MKTNTPSSHLEGVFLCPGREHFYVLIINVLQNLQAKTQAIFRNHNFGVVALNNNTIKMFIFSGILSILAHSANYSYTNN